MKSTIPIVHALLFLLMAGYFIIFYPLSLWAQTDQEQKTKNDAFSAKKTTGTSSAGSRDMTYVLDDGSMENSIGLTSGGDIMFMNVFQAIPGENVIDQILVAWGSVPAGNPARVILYKDPNNDSIPDDAVYLTEALTTVKEPNTNQFITVPIPPTPVSGIFFVAALYQYQIAGEYPAPIDENSYLEASWAVAHGTPGAFDVLNLTNNDIPPGKIGDYLIPGNWLLRAHGTGEPVPVCIIDLDLTKNSGLAMKSALDELSVGYHYFTTFPFIDLSYYNAIFVCLGIYNNNHVLTSAEGQALADYLNAGGNLFMEGGDTWAFDTWTPVHSMFHITPLSDGLDDTGPIDGLTGTFTEGMSFSYSGENNFMDHISAGASALAIFENQSPFYYDGVAYDAGTYKTIGASFEFGGLNDGISPSTKKYLMAQYLDFFGVQRSFLNVSPELFEFSLKPGKNDSTWLQLTSKASDPQPYLLSIEYLDSPSKSYEPRMILHFGKANFSGNAVKKSHHTDPAECSPAQAHLQTPAVASGRQSPVRAITDKAYGYDCYPNTSSDPAGFMSLYLNHPENVTPYGSNVTGSDYLSCDEWANGKWYAMTYNHDSLIVIDTATGSYTRIAQATVHADGMAWDPATSKMYICNFSGNVYTLNLTTGEATLVGSPGPGFIALATTNEGILYAVDILNDDFGTINKTNGAWTPVATLPFDANNAQDMATDRENNVFYYAAWVLGYGGQLWMIDPVTYDFTYMGDLEGAMEVTGLVITNAAPAHPWLTLSAYEGFLTGPFGSESVKVYYKSSGLSKGDYFANIHVYSVLSETTTVPVHLSIGSPEIVVEPTILTINPTDNLVPPPVASPESGSAGYGKLKALNIKPQDNRNEKKDFVPGKLLIKFRKNVTVDERDVSTNSADINSLFRNLNVRAIKRVFEDNGIRTAEKDAAGLFSIYLVKCPESADMKQAVRLLQSLPDVIYAEPDYLAYADYIPPDGMYPDQWGLNNTGQAQHNPDLVPVGTLGADIGAQQAWDIETGNASTVVAVLDEGVDLTHPEFAGRLLPGYDFFNNDNDPSPFDDDAHGTACTGIIAAAMNGTGIVGVAWNVNILPVKVMELGSGPYDVIAQGVVWSADQLADILSMSLGGSGYSATLEAAVNYAYTSGCVIVAAAGNSNVNNGMTPHYPCSFTNVISVGAMSPCNDRKTPSTCDGETWWGSNYGGGLDFVAPGVRIPTTDIMGAAGYTTGDYTPFFNGTSSACPHVSGIAALLLSHNPLLTPATVRAILQQSCTDLGMPGYDDETGYGRVDAYMALLLAGGANSFEIYNKGHGPLKITSITDNRDWMTTSVPPPEDVPTVLRRGETREETWEEVVNFNHAMLNNNRSGNLSAGLAPRGTKPIMLTNPSGEVRGLKTKAYGYNGYSNASSVPEGPVSFRLNGPENITSIGPELASGDFVCCSDWVNGLWYGMTYIGDSIITLDTATGQYTKITMSTAHADGMAWDPVEKKMYICNQFGDVYTLNITTGVAIPVGYPGNFFIAMACTNEGNLYAIDLATQYFGSISKMNGAWTPIGPVPFLPNFAQDMATDREDNRIYYAAFDWGAYTGQLWTIDHTSGEMTYINTFDGGLEVTALMIPTRLGRTIQPGNSLLVNVLVDWDLLGSKAPCATGVITVKSDDADEPSVYVAVNVGSDPVESATVLENDTVQTGSSVCYEGQYVIIAGGNGTRFIVDNGGEAYLVAGRKVYLQPGVHVYSGGYMLATITQTGDYCDLLLPRTMVSTEDHDDAVMNKTDNFILVYPNPTTGLLNAEVRTDDQTRPVTMEVYDFTGKKLVGGILNNTHIVEMDLSSYRNGIYIIKVIQGEEIHMKKVVKQ